MNDEPKNRTNTANQQGAADSDCRILVQLYGDRNDTDAIIKKESAIFKSLGCQPFVSSFEGYRFSSFQSDLRAGINVALLAFPQAMAYALIAGLPIQYGIFGAAIASVLGALFSSSRFVVLGPTNATAVMLMGAFISLTIPEEEKLTMLPLILVMTGMFLIVAYTIKAANLIQYVSRSVVTGYITAAALLIISNQVKNVLGFQFDGRASTFMDICYWTIIGLPKTHWPSLVLSFLTAGLYWALTKWLKFLPNVAITLLVMSLVCFGFNSMLDSQMQIATFAAFQASDWKLTLPRFDLALISQLGSLSMALAFLSVLEGTSIGKSLAARAGASIDVNREMLSIGIANIGCGLLSGMPASGSLIRSMLNFSSKAATSLSILINGVICGLGAILIGPYLSYIPKATLAALVIFLGISLINSHSIRIMLKTTRRDQIVFSATFLAALIFRLDTAIFFGTGLSIVLFLRKAAMPELVEYSYSGNGMLTELKQGQERAHPEISIVHVEGNLFFGAAELFRDQMRRICMEKDLKVVILKMRNALHLDATAALALEELIRYMNDRGRHLLISEIKSDVYRVFKASGILEVIREENIFRDDVDNPMLSTARAAKRAKELVDDDKAKVTIFA
ncbi:MAG: sulfate permease [Acidobacteria bacterium]|nr:MAG: sulfate permease [Acidobacteriota bacterium]